MATSPAMVIKIQADIEALKTQLASGSFAIEQTTQKMASLANSYSGARTVQQANDVVQAINAVGGVTNLTAKEQAQANRILDEAIQKYQAMGREAPAAVIAMQQATASKATPAMQTFGQQVETSWESINKWAGALGIGLGIHEVVEFGRHVFETAGQVGDMATKLGTSTEFVQRAGYAANQSGSDIGTVGTALAKMNALLSEGEDGTINALKKAGLEFDTIRSMKPEDAFYTITDAIKGIPDPMTRAEVAVKLFGKTGQELLPAIIDGFRDVGAAATVMSDSTVKSLKRASDDVQSFKDTLTALAANAFVAAGDGVKKFADWVQAFHIGLTQGKEAREDFEYGMRRLSGDLQNVGDVALTTANNVKPLTKAQMEAREEYEKATKAQNEAIATLKSYYGVAETVSAGTREEVNGWLDLGASVQTVQAAYRLTEGQMKLITQARESDIEASKKQREEADAFVRAESTAMAAAAKVWGEYHKQLALESGTSTDQQIADVRRWAEETARQFEASKDRAKMDGQVVADFYAGLSAATTEKIKAIGVDWKALQDAATNDSKAGLQQIADKAYATWQEALKHVGEWSDGTIEKFRQTYDAAQMAANNWAVNTGAYMDQTASKAVQTAATIKAAYTGLFPDSGASGTILDKRYSQASNGLWYKVGEVLPPGVIGGQNGEPWGGFRANGGPVSAGTAYTVGERGPEVFVPSTSGTIVPNGGSAASITINITQPLGTPQAIAAAVKSALAADARASGVRFAMGI